MTGKRFRASITVYLALVFVLILSMILVTVEAARAAVMRGCAKTALDAGMESVLADYYRPLFDRYKIFALDLGYGNSMANISEGERRLKKFASLNADDYTVNSSRITKTFPITSAGGEYFIRQAADAEKITMVEGVLEKLAEKLGLLTDRGDVSRALTKRMELETELAGLDMYTADLMRLVDGVDVDAKNLLTGKGVFKIGDSFVKRFMIGSTDRLSVGINNASIYESLKDKYSNPVERTAELALQMEEYATFVAEAEAVYTEIVPLMEEAATLESLLSEIEGKKESTENADNDADDEKNSDTPGTEGSSEADEIRQRLGELKEVLEQLNIKYAECMSNVRKTEHFCRTETGALNKLYMDTSKALKEAYSVTSLANTMQEELKPKVEAFEKMLANMGDALDADIRAQLDSSLNSMKEYVGMTNGQTHTDFAKLGKTLHADILLLNGNRATDYLTMPARDYSAIIKRAGELSVLAERMKDFSYDGMLFDYSTSEVMSESDAAVDAAANMFLDPVSDYWLKLLLNNDVSTISEASIKPYLLPVIEGREEADASGFYSLVSSIAGKGDNQVFSVICEALGEGLTYIYDKALFTMYLNDYFNNYAESETMSGTVLKYEQEYLICGNTSDKINLAGALAQILLIRFVPSLIYACTDKAVSSKAAAVAQSTVGFTGLPFLTLAVKYLILTVWAAEQAIIETSAVLRGKKVPVLTNSDSFCLELSELLSFNSALVEEKAGNFREGAVSLSYDEYLLILMLIKSDETLAGRAMDIIQENLRYAYEDTFLISNCIVGFCAEAEFGSEMKMIGDLSVVPGVKGIGGYSVTVEGESAYCNTK